MRQEELAHAAGISAPTLRRMELSEGVPGGIKNNLLAVERALADAGAEFIRDIHGIGVRLRRPETAVDLTRKITAMEADIATTEAEPPKTPKGGMQRLERAHKREVVTKLKNKWTRLAKPKK